MNYYPLTIKKHFTEQKSLYLLLLKIFISLGLVTFIIIKVNLHEIFAALKNARLAYAGIAFSMVFLNIYLQFRKWQLTANHILNIYDKKKIFYSLFYGLAGGAFTPARLGEYGGRAIVLKGITFLDVSSATIIEKLFILIPEIIFGIIAALFFFYLKVNVGFVVLKILIVVLIIISVGLFFFFRSDTKVKLKSLLTRVPYLGAKQDLINRIFNLDIKYFISMLIYTTLFYFCYVSQFTLFAASVSGNVNLVNCFWAGLLVMFSKSIFGYFSFGELGVREGAAVYFLSTFGEPGAAGFNTAIFLFITNLVLPALFGLLLMLKRDNVN